MKTPALKPHPAAQLFPMMSDAEIDELAADIKEHGQSHPITTWQGSILDGRNRYEACRRAAVEPRLVDWVPHGGSQSPTQWVLSENLHRRHLTVDQRALIALEASTLFAQEAKARQRAAGGDRRSEHAPDRLPPRGGKRSEERAPTAAAQAAQTAGVSARSVERARRVQASQPEILSRVRDGSMTLKQAEKAVVQRERMAEVLAYQPPQGRYSVIVADPPWRYDDTLDGSDLARGGVQYPTMSVEEICALKVGEGLATPDCALWLWVTNAFVIDGTAARVVREWGFEGKAMLTWRKDRIGAGRYLRNQTEHAILAIKGRPLVNGESTPNIFDAPRRGHSEKPAEAFAIFEKVTPAAAAARLELFARKPREGWRTSGSELTTPAKRSTPAKEEQTLAEWYESRKTDGDVHPSCGYEALDHFVWDAERKKNVIRCPPNPAENPVVWSTGAKPKKKSPKPSQAKPPAAPAEPVVWSTSAAKKARAKKHRPGQDHFAAPFHVQVGPKIYPGLHKDRQAAHDAATKDLGLFKFEVRDDNGVGSDFVDMPRPKKRALKKKPRAATAVISAKKPKEPKNYSAENVGAALHREHVERDLAAAAGRRLNGAGWKRAAAKARAENSRRVCHHCGEDAVDAGGVSSGPPLPKGVFCEGCCVRLLANPREFDRHASTGKPAQVSLDEAIARAAKPPNRRTKKFPLQGGPTEKCTACGAEQGQHAGTRCPDRRAA